MDKDEVDDTEDREPELVVIEEGSPEHKASQRSEEEESDEREAEGEEEERLGKSETTEEERRFYGRRREGETDEQYRERRRKERQHKKAYRQAAINRNKTELRYLETRNEQLERQNLEMQQRLKAVEGVTAQTQALTVDGRIAQVEGQMAEAKRLMAAAVEASNGEDVVQCQEIIAHLDNQLRGMKSYKEHLAKGGQPQQRAATEAEPERRQGSRVQPPADPKVAKHSQAFQEKLEWFDPSGKDPESATVYAIDIAMSGDRRFDPKSLKYWQELERRVRAALPHKFEEEEADLDDDDDDDEPRNTPVKGRGPRMPSGRQSNTRGGTKFYLSAERKQAMIDLGVYDDPVLKAKYIKKYREWDQQNAGRK